MAACSIRAVVDHNWVDFATLTLYLRKRERVRARSAELGQVERAGSLIRAGGEGRSARDSYIYASACRGHSGVRCSPARECMPLLSLFFLLIPVIPRPTREVHEEEEGEGGRGGRHAARMHAAADEADAPSQLRCSSRPAPTVHSHRSQSCTVTLCMFVESCGRLFQPVERRRM